MYLCERFEYNVFGIGSKPIADEGSLFCLRCRYLHLCVSLFLLG